MTKYDESYISKKFNHWTVLDVFKPSNTRNGVEFKVQCDCPHKMIKIRPASYVVGGQTKGCKHCRGKDLTGKM